MGLFQFGMATIADVVTTAANGIKTDALGIIEAVGPIALTITATFLGWKMGKRFFKSIGSGN